MKGVKIDKDDAYVAAETDADGNISMMLLDFSKVEMAFFDRLTIEDLDYIVKELKDARKILQDNQKENVV